MEILEHPPARGGVEHHHALGDLELEQVGREVGLEEDARHLLGEVGLAELARGDVHGDADRARPLVDPTPRLQARRLEHPVAELDHEPGFLGHGDELHGRDRAGLVGCPSEERLDPRDPFRRHLDLRLVVELHAASGGERAAEAALDPEASFDLLLDLRREQLEAVAAALLRRVHRRVGVHEERVHVTAVGGVGRDSRAARDHDLRAVDEVGLGNPLGELPEEKRGLVVRLHVTQDDDELVAAESRGHRLRSRRRVASLANLDDAADPPGDLLEERVAREVTDAVVDASEEVEVEGDDRDRLTAEHRLGEHGLEEPAGMRAVRQVRERVVEREVGDLPLGCSELGHVLRRPDHAHASGGLVDVGLGLLVDEPLLAVRQDEPVLDVMGTAARQHVLDVRAVLRVDPLEERVAEAAGALEAVEDVTRRLRPVEDLGLEVELPLHQPR